MCWDGSDSPGLWVGAPLGACAVGLIALVIMARWWPSFANARECAHFLLATRARPARLFARRSPTLAGVPPVLATRFARFEQRRGVRNEDQGRTRGEKREMAGPKTRFSRPENSKPLTKRTGDNP